MPLIKVKNFILVIVFLETIDRILNLKSLLYFLYAEANPVLEEVLLKWVQLQNMLAGKEKPVISCLVVLFSLSAGATLQRWLSWCKSTRYISKSHGAENKLTTSIWYRIWSHQTMNSFCQGNVIFQCIFQHKPNFI